MKERTQKIIIGLMIIVLVTTIVLKFSRYRIALTSYGNQPSVSDGQFAGGEPAATENCSTGICTQEHRLETLRKGCLKYPEVNFDPANPKMYDTILVDDRHKVLYCAMPKAASTSFYNFFYLSYTGKALENIHCVSCWEELGLVLLHSLNKEERDKRLREYYKILVVRHPLDRLVSCWHDKLRVRNNNKPVWTGNGPNITRMFRQVPLQSNLQSEIDKGTTFREFLKWIGYLEKTSPGLHNEHWNPNYRLCHPCSIDYDLIVKVETLESDSKFVMDKLQLQSEDFLALNSQRSNEAQKRYSKTLKEYQGVRECLSHEYWDTVKDIYKQDMELFDYKWNETSMEASCGKNCQCC